MKKIIFLMFLFAGLNSIQLYAEGPVTTPATVQTSVPKKSCTCEQSKTYVIVAAIIIAIIIALFIGLLIYSNILKDDVDLVALLANAQKLPKYQNVTDPSKIPRPYSLARTQLGIWTVVIASAYIYLSAHCCWIFIEFTASILGLMGISAGTAVVGNAIDKNQSTQAGGSDRHQNQPSEGFLTDILSDENGISIHRFQNLVFTLIGIVIFLYKIPCTDCGKLPELDPTLIALMGISTVTYLGMKVNENKS